MPSFQSQAMAFFHHRGQGQYPCIDPLPVIRNPGKCFKLLTSGSQKDLSFLVRQILCCLFCTLYPDGPTVRPCGGSVFCPVMLWKESPRFPQKPKIWFPAGFTGLFYIARNFPCIWMRGVHNEGRLILPDPMAHLGYIHPAALCRHRFTLRKQALPVGRRHTDMDSDFPCRQVFCQFPPFCCPSKNQNLFLCHS